MKPFEETEHRIQETLSPFEPLIMKIQSVLVWEKPRRSFGLFIIFHIVFLYIKYSGQRIVYILSMLLLIAFVIHTWRKKIWPEIRVRPPSPENEDQWVPMSLRLLSVPELSHHITVMWFTLTNWINKWLYLRTNHGFLFCVLNVAILSFMAIIGRYISGFLLIYLSFMSVILWPPLYYHDMSQKLYMYCEPVFMRLDYYLTFRGKFPGSENKEMVKEEGEEDFIPDCDPAVTAALARAITDSEDEEASSDHASRKSSFDILKDDKTLVEKDLMLPADISMPNVEDDPDDISLLDFLPRPNKRSKKTRPRAMILSDTFEPHSTSLVEDPQISTTECQSQTIPSSFGDVLSSLSTNVIARTIADGLLMMDQPADGRTNEVSSDEVDECNSAKRNVPSGNRDQQVPHDEIEQQISEDFDFLDGEDL